MIPKATLAAAMAVRLMAACDDKHAPNPPDAAPMNDGAADAAEEDSAPPDAPTPTCGGGFCTCNGNGCAPSQIGPYPCGLAPQFSSPTCTICCADACKISADCPPTFGCEYALEGAAHGYCRPLPLDGACGDAFCKDPCRCENGDAGNAGCNCHVPTRGEPCPGGVCAPFNTGIGSIGCQCLALDLPDGGAIPPTCWQNCISDKCAQDEACCSVPRSISPVCVPATSIPTGATCSS